MYLGVFILQQVYANYFTAASVGVLFYLGYVNDVTAAGFLGDQVSKVRQSIRHGQSQAGSKGCWLVVHCWARRRYTAVLPTRCTEYTFELL